MGDIPAPIIIKIKRKYTKKPKQQEMSSDLIPLVQNKPDISSITQPLQMPEQTKQKRKYTRRKPLKPKSPPKPKRKYTKKMKPEKIKEISEEIPSIITSIRPATSSFPASSGLIREPLPVPEQIKQKRKYTRRKPLKTKSPPKPKQNIDIIENSENITKEPVQEFISPKQIIKIKRKYTRRKIPENKKPLVLEKDIKLSPQSPIIMLQNAKQNSNDVLQPSNKRRLNEIYISLMRDLAFVMRHQKDFMRAKAYDNARDTISSFTEDITDPEQLRNKPGIGKTIHQKLIDFLENGTLNVLEKNKDLINKKRTIDIFLDIYGIGEKKAEELVDQGILSLDQLREHQDRVLNDKQKIGLKYYHDILQRIPRSEIENYENIFRKSSPDTLQIQIVGSYRRGLQSSGDIDAILTSQSTEDFRIFIDKLIENKTIIEVLSRGPSKCLVICKLPWAQYARRVDFLYTTPQEFPFSILYFTGSKGFNTAMREHALKLNMTLNEHGLSAMEGRKKGAAIVHEFPTEKSIFDYLNLVYKDPKDRIDGSAVIVKDSKIPTPITNTTTIEENQQLPQPVKISKTKTLKKTNVLKNIQDFKTNGVKVLEGLQEKELVSMVEKANLAFHTEAEPLMTDAEYDILRDFITEKFPKNKAVKEVGAEVTKNKAVLPYEMASMDKIKPDTGALTKWMQKFSGPYVISFKLDGVSGLYTTENPSSPKLYTRGDGKIGQDVSYLIPYLNLPKDKGIVIRGEFIIKRKVFEEKYKSKFSNSRNLVAGIVNAKSLDDKIRDVDFVAYEVIRPENLIPSKQMEFLNKYNIAVKHQFMTDLTNEGLSDILQKWRDSSNPENLYEIDGIIVSDDKVYPRTSGNPDHSFAFKMVLSDQIAETHVLDIEWNVSKDGYLKPRVRVSEVELGGVKINYVTGINGAFIEKNKIGIGAIVRIIRSGDVIPKIEGVVTPAENPKMPSVPYKWNNTHIDLILEGENIEANITMREKQITQFFKGIEVDGLGPGNVTKIVKAGYDSICKILSMQYDDFLKIEGFQKKTAEKLAQGIKTKIEAANLATIMSASNQFGRGFGKERIELILNEYPDVLAPDERNISKLKAVKGIAEKTAKEFIDNIPRFIDFLKECGLEYKITQTEIAANNENITEIDTTHPLYGKSIIMTGFRDKDLETRIKNLGAKLSGSVSKNTFLVLVKSMEEDTGKIIDAKRLGITIMLVDEFKHKYFI